MEGEEGERGRRLSGSSGFGIEGSGRDGNLGVGRSPSRGAGVGLGERRPNEVGKKSQKAEVDIQKLMSSIEITKVSSLWRLNM